MCYNQVNKSKQNRKSIVRDDSASRSAPSTARSSEISPIDKTHITHNNQTAEASNTNDQNAHDLPDSASLLTAMNKRLINMENNYNKMHDAFNSTLKEHLSMLPSSGSDANNVILSEVTKISHNFGKLVTLEQFKTSLGNMCASFEKKLESKTSEPNSANTNPRQLLKSILANKTDAHRNAFDWSAINDSLQIEEDIDGGPSIVIRQSVDDSVVEIVKNSDITTWNTLDLLFKEVKSQTDKINDIGDTISSLSTVNSNDNASTNVRSPLVESIMYESLDKIQSEILEIKSKCFDLADQLAHFPQSSQSSGYQNTHTDENASGSLSPSTNTAAHSFDQSEVLSNSLLFSELNANEDATPKDNTDGIISTGSAPQALLEFHVSRFARDTTEQMVLDYIGKHGVSDTSSIKVYRLVPRMRDINRLSFVSFKIDVNEETSQIITRTNFWPPQCIVKEFEHRPSRVTAKINEISSFTIPVSQPNNSNSAHHHHFLAITGLQNPIQ